MTRKRSQKPKVVTLGDADGVSCACEGATPPVAASGKGGKVFEPKMAPLGKAKRQRRQAGTRGLARPPAGDPVWGTHGSGGSCQFVTHANVGTRMEVMDVYPASAEGWDDAVTAAAALRRTHGASDVGLSCTYSGERRTIKLAKWGRANEEGAIARHGWTRQPATAPIAGLGRSGAKSGSGSFCVFSRNDKLVRCFRQRETAEKVARGFGPGFRVKSKDRG